MASVSLNFHWEWALTASVKAWGSIIGTSYINIDESIVSGLQVGSQSDYPVTLKTLELEVPIG
jgi:hypothetical protein